MSLTHRLSAFFLAGLAVVLVGFSVTLMLLAQHYLHRQLDEQVVAALNTLAAAAELEDGGFEWKITDRHFQVGGGDTVVDWAVHDGAGKLVACAPDLRQKDPLRQPLDPNLIREGVLKKHACGEDRRCQRRVISAPAAVSASEDFKDRYQTLVFTAAASEKPAESLLGRLGTALIGSSAVVWMTALFASRRFCRRALRPVAVMAAQATAMNAIEPAARLVIPSSQDELETLGHAFNRVLDRLHEALERQRRFTGDASHQLRTPLTALLGQVDVALRHPRSTDEYQRLLHQVRQQGQHLAQIVEMLLFLARTETEGKLDNLDSVDLKAWLNSYLEGWSKHPRGHDLQYAPANTSSVWVHAQAPLLGQLLDNLIDNAFKYSEPGTPVIVRLEAEENGIELSLEDRGIGIADDDAAHLFDPFFRGETARRLGRGGAGLGLSIALRIARLFGGRLNARGRAGEGSRFTLHLPRLAAPSAGEAADIKA